MLSKIDLEKIKDFGIDVESFISSVKSENEEETAFFSTGTYLTDEQLSKRDITLKEEGKRAGFDEGKRAGFEIANKTIIEKFGIKDKKKTDDTAAIVESLKTNLSVGDADINRQISELLSEKETLQNEINRKEKEVKQFKQKTALLSYLPKERNSLITDDEYLTLIQQNIKEMENGEEVVELNGEILRDQKTRTNLNLKDAVAKIFEARNWLEQSQSSGRGVGDANSKSSGFRKFSEFEKDWIARNGEESYMGIKFQQALREAAKSPDFDINS